MRDQGKHGRRAVRACRGAAALCIALLATGCGRSLVLTAQDLPGDGEALPRDGALPQDGALPRDSAEQGVALDRGGPVADRLPADRGPDLWPPDLPGSPDKGSCACRSGEVWRRSACVPTDQLGCGSACDSSLPNACAPGQTCDPCAAAPSCQASSCRPACVPVAAMGFPPGALRVSPTTGNAGAAVQLSVQGGEFYIGALWWSVGLGPGERPVNAASLGRCGLIATVTPSKPGVFPVMVGYGTNKPSLAGFYTASGGSLPPKTVQPGYPCGGGDVCAEATPFRCQCQSGRCVCN